MSKTQFALQATGFDALYGLEILSLGEEEATARVAVRDEVKQPAGLVHGGATPRSPSGLDAPEGREPGRDVAQGSPARRASCARSCRARSTHRPPPPPRPHDWVWEVDITDDEGRLCALVRMTVAVRQP